MQKQQFPAGFRQLEAWLDWSQAAAHERITRRHLSRIEDPRAFYSGVLPSVDDVLAVRAGFPCDEVADGVLTLAEGMPAVAKFWQLRVVDGYGVCCFVSRHEHTPTFHGKE